MVFQERDSPGTGALECSQLTDSAPAESLKVRVAGFQIPEFVLA